MLGFVLTAIFTVMLALLGYSEYKPVKAELKKRRDEYITAGFMSIGYGLLRLINLKTPTNSTVYNRYVLRYNSSEKSMEKYRAYIAQIITFATLSVLITQLLSAVCISEYGYGEESLVLTFIGLFIAAMSGFLFRRREMGSMKRRTADIVSELPQLMNKIIVLLGSGKPMATIIEEIGRDCADSMHPLYEEMAIVYRDIKNNKGVCEALNSMQQRCMCSSVSRFTTEIIQSINGSAYEADYSLMALAEEMWKEKRNNDKLRCAALKDKLVIPTTVAFGIVMLIVIIPAFLTMEMI